MNELPTELLILTTEVSATEPGAVRWSTWIKLLTNPTPGPLNHTDLPVTSLLPREQFSPGQTQ